MTGESGTARSVGDDLIEAVAEVLWDEGLGGCDDPACDDDFHGSICQGSRWAVRQAAEAVVAFLSDRTAPPVAFIRCECGEEWRYSINLLDGNPVWMRPKAKRGAVACQHEKERAEALVDGEWIRVDA